MLATFEQVANGKTNVVFRQIFDSAEACNKIKPYVIDKNGGNPERLEQELLKMTGNKV